MSAKPLARSIRNTKHHLSLNADRLTCCTFRPKEKAQTGQPTCSNVPCDLFGPEYCAKFILRQFVPPQPLLADGVLVSENWLSKHSRHSEAATDGFFSSARTLSPTGMFLDPLKDTKVCIPDIVLVRAQSHVCKDL